MDYAVALIQAYLRVNGYFTVTEYPVFHTSPHEIRVATDLDILALRFARSGETFPGAHMHGLATVPIAAALGARSDEPDMIIGEVKEGRAELNAALTKPPVIEAALVRFGCCSETAAPALVSELLARGSTMLESGHRLRIVSFGSLPPERGHTRHHVVLLGDVIRFLQAYVGDGWEALRHAELKDPGLALFSIFAKAGIGPRPEKERP